jgi:hypothetical protein
MRLKTTIGALITTKPQTNDPDSDKPVGRKERGTVAILPGTDDKGFGREYPEIDPKNKVIAFQLAALVDAKIIEVEPGLEKLIPTLEQAEKDLEGLDICDAGKMAPHLKEIEEKKKLVDEKRARQRVEAEKKAAEEASDGDQTDEDAGEPAQPAEPTPEPETEKESAPEPEKKPKGNGKKK